MTWLRRNPTTAIVFFRMRSASQLDSDQAVWSREHRVVERLAVQARERTQVTETHWTNT